MKISLSREAPLPSWVAIPSFPTSHAHLYLHGSGERGEDSEALCRWSLPGLISRGLDVPFIVVAPICPLNHDWGEKEVVEAAVRCLDIAADSSGRLKLSISGFSMGARGVWIAIQKRQIFSRAMVVAGRTAPALLNGEPISAQVRVIHGELDDHESAPDMRNFCEKVGRTGVNIEYEEIPRRGHFIADEIFGRQDVLVWLSERPVLGREPSDRFSSRSPRRTFFRDSDRR